MPCGRCSMRRPAQGRPVHRHASRKSLDPAFLFTGSDSGDRDGLGAVGGSPTSEAPPPSFIVETVAPEPPEFLGFSPDSGAPGDGVTNRTEFVLTGMAEGGSTVTVRDGQTELGTASADSSGAWSFSAGDMAEGVHSFTATSSDAAGNTGAASVAFTVTIDTRPPSAALSTVRDDATGALIAAGGLTNDNTPMLSGTAEAGSAVQVILSRAGSQDLVLTPSLSGTDWSITPATPLTDGAYTITLKVTDPAGNVTQVSAESWK